MELTQEQTRSLIMIFLTSCGAVATIFLTATLSILIVFALKTAVKTVLELIALILEIGIAIVAALTSGATVSLIVFLATIAAALSFPASCMNARICMTMIISSASVFASSMALTWFSSFRLDIEVAIAVVSAAAMSVSLASAWATGVLTLIEKETEQVGLKLTSILDAVRNNNHRILRFLVKLHFGLKKSDLDIALLHAVRSGYYESIKVLLKAGANPDARDSYDNSSLTIACEAGLYNVAKILVKYGANVNIMNGARSTPIHSAAKWGYEDCVHLLVTNGADVNCQDSLWRTPLMLCVKHAKNPNPVMRLLIENGAEVNKIGCERRTVMHYAASRGLAVTLLLESGAIPHLKDCEGNTPIHYAASEGHMTITTKLLQVGCDPNSLNNQDRTPLHMAAMGRDISCVDLLLRENAKPYIIDRIGNLPIYYAAHYGHINSVLSLLTANSPLGVYQYKNITYHPSCPLLAALENRHFKIAKLLMIGGCSFKTVSDWMNEQPIEIHDRYVVDFCMLKDFIQNPETLLHKCRIRIRNIIGQNLNKKLEYLQLPKLLKEYIMMKDLIHLQDESEKMLNAPVSSLVRML